MTQTKIEDIPAYVDFLKQIKTNLWVIGIPYGSSKVNIRFIGIYFQLLLMIVLELSYLISKISSENFLEIMQLAPCTGNGILTALRTITLIQKRTNIYKLTECLDKLYQNILNDDKKTNLVKKDLILVNLFVKYYFILNMVLISVYIFSSPVIILVQYFSTHEIIFRLPWPVLLPFPTDNWPAWIVLYIHSIMVGYICIFLSTTVDGFYFVLTSHVCAHFSVLSDMIKNLDNTHVHLLADIVKEHQNILKLGDDLEDIFTASNLFNVLVGSLEICALGFNLTLGSWEGVPGCMLFLMSVIMGIFMMSVFGENIMRESLKVGDAAFLCKWYKMDEKSKKIILTIMIRSRKPQQLTAYKFSTICYANFSKIISTSWSYFTILRTVYTPPDK